MFEVRRQALRAFSIFLVAGCNALPTDAPTEHVDQQLTGGTTYVIKLPKMSGDTGNCVDVAGASLVNQAKVQEWDCNGTAAQSFVAEDMGGGYFRLKNTNSGKCLNIYGGVIDAAHSKSGNQDGSLVQQYTCGTGDNNEWRFVASNGFSAIVSKLHSGDGVNRCLDVIGGPTATANGTGLQIWTCNNQGNQTFNPTTAAAGTSSGGTPAPAPAPQSSSCTFATWVAGKSYNPGDIVTYSANKQNYVCTNANPGYDPTISTWFWSPYSCSSGGGTIGATSSGGSSAAGIAGVLSSAQFDSLFPSRNAIYTYAGLTSTASTYAAFANSTNDTLRKREVAAFLANISWESDWLAAVREYQTSNYCDYCDPYAFGCGGDTSCACPAGACNYFGRGPIQLTWPGNYQAAGSAIGADLLHNPDLVATNSSIAWKTGVWYWMTGFGPGGYGNNCHDAMMASDGAGGFGATVMHINGGQECAALKGTNTAARDQRIARYKMFCDMLGVSYGNNLSC
jgi:predicted chitinase